MHNTLISIIVPIYNVEPYLNRCIDSILSQTYKDLEILLVDDGSPDNCGSICDDYANMDSRIKVIHKVNGGLSDARNEGINKATGQWITFIDSDDYISPDYVETLFSLTEKFQCKVAVSSYNCFLEGTEPHKTKSLTDEKVLSVKDAVDCIFYQNGFETSAWGKMYHRTLFDTGIRYPKGWLYEDLPTTFRLFLESDKVAFCNKETYFYLLRSTSIEGTSFSIKKLESALNIIEFLNSNNILNKRNQKSKNCRLLSLCFHVLLEMPKDFSDGRKQILKDFIKQHRWSVFFDFKVRLKNKVAILLSLLGIENMKSFLKLANKRK